MDKRGLAPLLLIPLGIALIIVAGFVGLFLLEALTNFIVDLIKWGLILSIIFAILYFLFLRKKRIKLRDIFR